MRTIIGTTPFMFNLLGQHQLFAINTKHNIQNDNNSENILRELPVIFTLIKRVYVGG